MIMTTKTSIPKNPGEIRRWLLVDAAKQPLGRLAVVVANKLRGKDRPDFDPSVDIGDFVVVVNAEKVKMTGIKWSQKTYEHYTKYPGGRRIIPAADVRQAHPDRVIMEAVRRMLPKNKIGLHMLTKLKVYSGAEHPHQAQQPEKLEL